MRVLVTGGAGYIGSHAARALLDRGHSVVVLDNLRAGHRSAVDPRATFIKADLRDTGAVTDALEGVAAVLHFAALSVVGDSIPQALAYWENNVGGTLSLLRAMDQRGVRRLVFSSTAATYGVPDRLPIVEDTPQQPINPYGATKLAVERALADVCAASGLSATVLRYFNVAGCALDGTLGEDHRPETHLIPILLQVALGRRDEVQIFGTDYDTPDGTCIRDYVHVEDLVNAHILALEAAPAGLRAYNVGIGRGYSVLEILEAARRVTGAPIPARPAPRRLGDPPVLFTDPTRLQTKLGWVPQHTRVDDLIASAWRWVQAHPFGYED